MKNILTKVKGYKTFVVALCGFVYGVGTNNVEVILASLALAGLRDAMNK